MGIYLKHIAVYRLASNLGIRSASALPFFDALSCYDTTSSMFGKNKKTFYGKWKCFPEVTKVLLKLVSMQQKIEMYEEDIALLEQCFVMVYNATCNATDTNTCRRIFFANGASIENIPRHP